MRSGDDRAEMRHVHVTAATLRQWYVDERLTVDQIAKRLGCGATTIIRRLRAAKITARPRGPWPRSDSDRRRIPAHSDVWRPELSYAVGLIATDGNRSRDGRHLSVVSADRELLETLKTCLALQNRICDKYNGDRRCYRLQWSDRVFYDDLVRVGLHPAKTLTLEQLRIPEATFADFFRGCIDGDGSIVTYGDRSHAARNPRYVYERLYVSLVSASPPSVEWLRHSVRRLTGAVGSISPYTAPGRRPVFRLRYATRESMAVLRWMYYSPTVPCLARKRAIADVFLSRYS